MGEVPITTLGSLCGPVVSEAGETIDIRCEFTTIRLQINKGRTNLMYINHAHVALNVYKARARARACPISLGVASLQRRDIVE